METAKTKKTGKVLIVDDEADAVEALVFKLQKSGIHIETASTGDEAYEKLKKNSYNVLLLDIRIPGKDGFALLESLKMENRLNGARVILFTNYTSLMKKASEYGVDGVFLKANTSVEEITKRVLSFFS